MRVHAIAREADGETTRRGVVFDRFSSESAERLQPRQAEGHAGATEEVTTRGFHGGDKRLR